MRKVLIKRYDGEWFNDPELDDEVRFRPHPSAALKPNAISANHMDTVGRNAVGAVNSYKVIDVIRDDKEQVLKIIYPLVSIEHWDFLINEGMELFLKQFNKRPQILLMNETTLTEIEAKLPPPNVLGEFHSKLGELSVCIDNDLAYHDFAIVHDEQAEFVDPEHQDWTLS